MKIRSDFVTNSSSSSFILGIPNGNTTSTKDAIKYIEKLNKEVRNDFGVYYEFLIDLRYDKNKQYTKDEIEFILEVINWYIDEDIVPDGITYDVNYGCYWWIDDNYEYCESYGNHGLPYIEEDADLTEDNIKAILEFAYKNLGEIIVGNSESQFYNYEFYDKIANDKSIKFKCNHMG